MNQRLLFSHAMGNTNVRAALTGLFESGILAEFHTTIAAYPGNIWDVLGRSKWGHDFHRRSFDGRFQVLTAQHPMRELGRVLARKLKLIRLNRHETGMFCVDAVNRALDARVALRLRASSGIFTGVYAYEDGAVMSFRAAKELGLRRFYDLPTGHWRAARRLLSEEKELQPDWAETLLGNRNSPEKLARKDEEITLADEIFVASSFTRRTLVDAGYPESNIQVIPYGAPDISANISETKSNGGKRLKVLFVGTLGQQKGLSYLLKAVDLLGPTVIDLTLIGWPVSDTCVPLCAALTQHRHLRSLPHAGVLAEMRRHDVFVFPSLFDGFGLVLLEAMSQGLPVITTANTGAPDFVTEGKDGFIVPIRSAVAIAEKLELLHKNRDLLAQMSHDVLRTAEFHTWQKYQQAIVGAVQYAM